MSTKENVWIRESFMLSPEATLLVQNGQVILKNKHAKQLIDELQIDEHYLIDIAHSKYLEDQSTANNCSTCTVKMVMNSQSIPIKFFDEKSGLKILFTMDYFLIDPEEQIFSLILKNGATTNRVQKMSEKSELVKNITRAQENERKKIAEDLHDSIAQSVFSSIMGLNNLKTKNPDEAADIEQIQQQLKETLTEIKQLAIDIRPAVLDQFGLVPAINSLIKRLSLTTDIELTFINRIPDNEELDANLQVGIYRLAQESITNAIKHSKAKTIVVILLRHQSSLTLEVIDDGVGFDINKSINKNGKSLGMLNMNERVKALGGFFQVNSHFDEGTTIKASFPVKGGS